MIRCDAHMHTRFSEDSDASVHSMLDAAIERGMEQSVLQIIWIKISRRLRIFRQEHFCLIWETIFRG